MILATRNDWEFWIKIRDADSGYQGHHQEAQTEDAEFQLIWDCRRWLSMWEDYANSHSPRGVEIR